MSEQNRIALRGISKLPDSKVLARFRRETGNMGEIVTKKISERVYLEGGRIFDRTTVTFCDKDTRVYGWDQWAGELWNLSAFIESSKRNGYLWEPPAA